MASGEDGWRWFINIIIIALPNSEYKWHSVISRARPLEFTKDTGVSQNIRVLVTQTPNGLATYLPLLSPRQNKTELDKLTYLKLA